MEEKVMSLTLHQKRAIFWTLGIATMATLTTVAWSQIHALLTQCFLQF